MLDFVTSNAFAMFLIGLFTIYTLHYLINAVAKPKLVVANGKFCEFIKNTVPAVQEFYWPAFWCFYSHFLTRFSNTFREMEPKLKFYRELLTTPDGGTISLDWYDPEAKTTSLPFQDPRPIVTFIPGLTGTSRAEYLRHLIQIAQKIGYRPVVINYRGLCDTPLTTPRLYCAANHEDLEFALGHLRKLNPNAKLIATALSMGGTLLTGYLIKTGRDSLIDAAFLISVCWDFDKGAKQLKRGYLNPIFNKWLTQLLVNVVLKHRAAFEDKFDLDSFRHFTTLRQIDQAFTIKNFKFSSTDEYYRTISYANRVNEVKIPMFCLNSADDMIVPEGDLPLRQIEGSSHVAMLVPKRGGHIGFMEGILPKIKPSYFMERVYGQYMKALFELKENPKNLIL